MHNTILGLMSGSSLDGLDIALCTFSEEEGRLTWRIESAETIPYDATWREVLRSAPSMDGLALMKLDAAYGRFIGEQVHQWIRDHLCNPILIASHGHTVFHEPSSRFTTQIGSGSHIVAQTNIDTVTSFRNSDVALGGQGAPFAPIADRDLFPGYAGYLNLGGIVNVSVNSSDGWKAWDIGPCCQVLNYLAEKTGVPFDRDGNMAASGTVNDKFVENLVTHFPPTQGKAYSLSNADVHRTWIQLVEEDEENIADQMASVTEAIAQLVLSHMKPHIHAPATIFCTGGGAHHLTLFNALNLQGALHQITFEKPADIIINFKEGLLMAYLGYLHLHNKGFGIYKMTGACRDHIGGVLCKALS